MPSTEDLINQFKDHHALPAAKIVELIKHLHNDVREIKSFTNRFYDHFGSGDWVDIEFTYVKSGSSFSFKGCIVGQSGKGINFVFAPITKLFDATDVPELNLFQGQRRRVLGVAGITEGYGTHIRVVPVAITYFAKGNVWDNEDACVYLSSLDSLDENVIDLTCAPGFTAEFSFGDLVLLGEVS